MASSRVDASRNRRWCPCLRLPSSLLSFPSPRALTLSTSSSYYRIGSGQVAIARTTFCTALQSAFIPMSHSTQQLKDVKSAVEDEPDCRLYVGNLDYRISESSIIKMFSSFGKIVSEDFLLHKHGPKRGEPRGYAFVQYNTKEEAQLAKSKMNGRLFFGRPIVVRLASEKTTAEGTYNVGATSIDTKQSSNPCNKLAHLDKDAKIAAIKKKLKSLEGEGSNAKKPRLQTDKKN